jgi:hypothetical protein
MEIKIDRQAETNVLALLLLLLVFKTSLVAQVLRALTL